MGKCHRYRYEMCGGKETSRIHSSGSFLEKPEQCRGWEMRQQSCDEFLLRPGGWTRPQTNAGVGWGRDSPLPSRCFQPSEKVPASVVLQE